MLNLNDILKLPQRTLVNKKITKAFFKRNFELTISEKNLLDDYSTVIGFDWLATISPHNANVVGYSDETSTYEEVQVISVQIGTSDFERNSQRITELVQKYIPYHTLLYVHSSDKFLFNTCDKRINQNDSSRRTIEKRFFTETLIENDLKDHHQGFLASLSFEQLDKTNLKTFYESYAQRIVALQAADVSGFFMPRSQNRTEKDMRNLEQIEALTKEVANLQKTAQKESQLAVRVQLNIQIQQKRKQIDELKNLLTA